METCPDCNRQLEASWKFCIHCGAALRSTHTPMSAALAGQADAPPMVPLGGNRYSQALIVGGAAILCLGVTLLILTLVLLRGGFA
ncbi:zinc-ribbon domain-containing protein [Galbitalea soli]|uniref:Zinc ribbon domain-containing protein n=1 Tax=Galbitalea soli TaxID=1268042 RepID=A0A7C9PP89_9MICO|nr:zinc-ribbon domain-containing protein [Galbitalea soli]NEM92214.1 zinc ribbon domain-containing protein [Galbitalea soli]NYJ31832.1 hypothetical protein [Galbitalea soli]